MDHRKANVPSRHEDHRIMNARLTLLLFVILHTCTAEAQQTPTWRYYRPTNTGIQGDYNEAIYIGLDNDPWIGGYHPGFEEGGIAKFIQAENRWINISNVDYPVIGHPDDVSTTVVTEIVADSQGVIWMATGRGALKFNPSVGPSSLVKYGPGNSNLPGGFTNGIEIAPDGTIWFSAHSTFYGGQGLTRYNPATDTWTAWQDYGDGSVAAQPNSGGGYYIWATENLTGQIARLNSTTQTWTTYSQVTNAPWSLPGKACTDAAGNTWMYRLTGPHYATQVLDCLRPDGSWIGPPVPSLPNVVPAIWAFRAFGNMQALLADGESRIWRFNSTSWQDLGIWRDGLYTQDLGIDSVGNVWVCGIGGAAKRNPTTGTWQRYRVTNTSQMDFFVNDLSMGADGTVWVTQNASSGIGGMARFDGTRWYGWNDYTYGLGAAWPFPTDDAEAITYRPSNGHIAVNPTFNGVREWTGSTFLTLDNGLTVNPKRLVEDSMGRLWSIDGYFSLRYHNGSTWTQVGIAGSGGRIQRDPERPGTIWATTQYEVTRTDGVYRYSRTIPNFPELDTSATSTDGFSGMAPAPGGIAWIGATVHYGVVGNGGALIRLDANNGTYQMLRYNQGWPFPGQYVSPLAVTPDDRVWMSYSSEYPSTDAGLCWYDGTNVGMFPAPPNGEPQWGGLPHAGIKDLEVKIIPGGYELWMSCISRGIAVLRVPYNPTSVGESQKPSTFLLAQNYPNPFNPSTTINYQLPSQSHVTLKVFDLLGREVATVVDGVEEPGYKSVQFDGHNLASGTYFYQLRAGEFVDTKRFLLLR
jgi:hypothetical protein